MSRYFNNFHKKLMEEERRKKEMAKTLMHVSRPKRKKKGLLKSIRTGTKKSYPFAHPH
jgi:hypothetical protein